MHSNGTPFPVPLGIRGRASLWHAVEGEIVRAVAEAAGTTGKAGQGAWTSAGRQQDSMVLGSTGRFRAAESWPAKYRRSDCRLSRPLVSAGRFS